MDKKFYAHTRPINENGVERTEYQLLSDHERGVGTLCGQFAEAFGAQAEGHEAGVHHDDRRCTKHHVVKQSALSRLYHGASQRFAGFRQHK